MRINKSIVFIRDFDLSRYKSSILLLGPRMTGKTTLLAEMQASLSIDLLDLEQEALYRSQPGVLWEQLQKLERGALVCIDEIQKIPELLNTVQRAIDKFKIRFILSGSSARKLRRSGANLLGGRAIDMRVFPLSLKELDGSIKMEEILKWGSLPKIVSLILDNEHDEATAILRSYQSLYIQQEIQLEAAVRNLVAFQRFMAIAAACHGQTIEYSTIGRDCGVSAPTVAEYFQILEDSLVGYLLWPHNRSERKKARPKFYFFDNGVVRAIQGRLSSTPSSEELGHLFEGWFVQEVRRILHYQNSEYTISFWREGRHEIDLLILRSGAPVYAYEIKSGKNIKPEVSESAFVKRFPKIPLAIVSLQDKRDRILDGEREVLTVESALSRIREL